MMSERSIKSRVARTRFGLGTDATEHASYVQTPTNSKMQALISQRWKSASLKAKLLELDEHIDFIVRLCPLPLRTLSVEMTESEIARVCLYWKECWLYSSPEHPTVIFELERAR